MATEPRPKLGVRQANICRKFPDFFSKAFLGRNALFTHDHKLHRAPDYMNVLRNAQFCGKCGCIMRTRLPARFLTQTQIL